jgi:enoyl-CoA hydratase
MAELITKKENAVGWVIFSNPAKMNAVTIDMWQAFPKALAAFDADPQVRVIAVTGDGEKSFISGADISQFEKARGSAEAQGIYNDSVSRAYDAPQACSKPVIAKIRGICIGGGLGLAAACDVRIAAEGTKFRMPAARLGLGYTFKGVNRFVQVLGEANTADLFYSARMFDAAEAYHMGFVRRVVPLASFDAEVAEYLKMVSENAPLTVASAKFSISQTREDAAGRDLKRADRMVAACFNSEDYREGRTAFMEKRTPNFKGR